MNSATQSEWDSMPLLGRWLSLRDSNDVKPHFVEELEVLCGEANAPHQDRGQQTFWHFFEDNFGRLLRNIPISLWHDVIEAAPRANIPLTAREIKHITSLSVIWRKLESRRRAERLEAVEPLIDLLQVAWGWVLVKYDYIGNECVVFVRPKVAGAGLPPYIPIIVTFVFGGKHSSEKAFRWTRDLQRRLVSRSRGGPELIFNIVVGRGLEARKYLSKMRAETGFVFIDELVVREVFTAERYSAKLHEILQRGLGLGRSNPYNFDKPVEKMEMFYGREAEIRQILDRSNLDFIIVGSRKIGKSSLLRYLENTTRGSGSRVPVLLDCSAIERPDDFAKEIAIRVNPRRQRGVLSGHIPQLLGAARSIRQVPFLLLLDEADKLINFARSSGDWSVFNALREISNRGVGQTVITGYREVYRAWQDLKSPLFNFVRPMYLSVLSDESARKLITRPAADLGVSFHRKELVRQIIVESGCHPSVLQFFGSSLIDRLDQTGSLTVMAGDVHAVRGARQYLEFVVKPFRLDGNIANSLEKWLVLRIVKSKEERFSADSLVDNFKQVEGDWLKVGKLTEALEGLELSGLICREGERTESEEERASVTYVWTIPAFAIALERTTNVWAWEEELRDVLASGQEQTRAMS